MIIRISLTISSFRWLRGRPKPLEFCLPNNLAQLPTLEKFYCVKQIGSENYAKELVTLTP